MWLYQDSDLPKYKEYWFKEFPKVLKWYYLHWNVDRSNSINNFILSADHRSFSDAPGPNLLRLLLGDGVGPAINNQDYISKDEYFFSASMYYLSLIPQIICKIISPGAARCFLNSSGWPAISLGMGGFMSAKQVLYESGLLPYSNEVDRYISLLKVVHIFHKKELSDYMSGSAANLSLAEYAVFSKEVKGAENRVLKELDECYSSFIKVCEDIKAGKEKPWNMMYLENNTQLYE